MILGYFTPDGSLKAYLSYVPSAQGELVLDDLYVQQGERLKGVGTALAKAFVTRSLKEGEFAYWPVAATEEARKTAEAAGFTVCASRIVLETF